MFRLKAALAGLLFSAIVAAIIFVAAGRWDLPFVWGVMAILATCSIALARFANEGMIRERVKPGGADQHRLSRILGILLLLASWILVGLDVGRFRFSPIPWTLQLAGLIGYAASMAFLFWAMLVNPFYSSAVRIQSDRGHRVISSGPYRLVRHPGYAASLFCMIFGGLALGSWIAMLPLLAIVIVFFRRTIFEDKLLQRELNGYVEYAKKVRYRLVPGVF